MAQEETYEIKTYCSNCGAGTATWGYTVPLEILKGQLVADFLASKVCENCGCQGCLRHR